MARCTRNGFTYKRHQFKSGKCKACGDPQKPHIRKIPIVKRGA